MDSDVDMENLEYKVDPVGNESTRRGPKYMALMEALESFDRGHLFKLVNIYGIIADYRLYKEDADGPTLILHDETCHQFEIQFNNQTVHFELEYVTPGTIVRHNGQSTLIDNANTNAPLTEIDSKVNRDDNDDVKEDGNKWKEFPLEIGNILRIQNVALCRDFTIRVVRNVTCQSFDISEEELETLAFDNGEVINTIEENLRFRALQDFLAQKVLLNPMKYVSLFDSYPGRFRLDLAFEILSMQVNDNSLILVGWNGQRLENKCANLVTIEELAYTVSHRPTNDIVLSEQRMISLYNNQEFINVTVYGDYWKLAETIRPFDYVIAFGLVCKPSEEEFDRYCYNAFMNESCFSMKPVDKRSIIGLKISKSIRESLNVPVGWPLPDLSLGSIEESLDSSILNRSAIQSRILENELSHIRNCKHEIITNAHKRILTKIFESKQKVLGNNSCDFVRIASLEQLESNHFSKFFTVRSCFVAIVSSVPCSVESRRRTIFDNIDEIRRYATIVHCPRCRFECSFRDYQDDDIDHEDAVIVCKKCKASICKLFISLKIMLRDETGKDRFANFCGQMANDWFSIRSNRDFFHSDSSLPNHLSVFFTFLTHISKDRNSCVVDVDWKIARLKNTKDNVVYQICDFEIIPEEN